MSVADFRTPQFNHLALDAPASHAFASCVFDFHLVTEADGCAAHFDFRCSSSHKSSNKALDRKRRATPVLFSGVTDRRFGQLSRSAKESAPIQKRHQDDAVEEVERPIVGRASFPVIANVINQ